MALKISGVKYRYRNSVNIEKMAAATTAKEKRNRRKRMAKWRRKWRNGGRRHPVIENIKIRKCRKRENH
jgi:uncharacterized protein (DUF305 family)